MILLDDYEMVIEYSAQIQNKSGGSEEVVILNGEEIEFEVEVEVEVQNDDEEDTNEGLQLRNEASNDRVKKMLKTKTEYHP